jgi:hypothetical protein
MPAVINIPEMLTEITRLLFGILLLAFHRQVADFVLEQERVLVGLLRERGLQLPGVPTRETCRNIYFIIGTFVVLYEMLRIWLILHGKLIA